VSRKTLDRKYKDWLGQTSDGQEEV